MDAERDHSEFDKYEATERALFAQLPREATPPAEEEERLVGALRAEGFFCSQVASPRRTPVHRMLQLAAAVVLLAAGGVAGAHIATRDSLETLLEIRELSLTDRVLLLQRAGSAYVRAAHGYADAAATTDSTAVEVSRQVLIGAAHAVARTDLDGGLSQRLASMLRASAPSSTSPVARQSPIWF